MMLENIFNIFEIFCVMVIFTIVREVSNMEIVKVENLSTFIYISPRKYLAHIYILIK